MLKFDVNRKPNNTLERIRKHQPPYFESNQHFYVVVVCDKFILQNRKTFEHFDLRNRKPNTERIWTVKHKSTFILGPRTPIHFGSRYIFWNRNSNLDQLNSWDEFELYFLQSNSRKIKESIIRHSWFVYVDVFLSSHFFEFEIYFVDIILSVYK